MTWTLCTSGSAIAKAGKNAYPTLVSYAGTSKTILDGWSDDAEGFASSVARVDLVTNFTSLTTNGKQIISELVSSHIAQKIVHYDMSSYTNRGEATQMLNVLENNIVKTTSLIKEGKIKSYLGAT